MDFAKLLVLSAYPIFSEVTSVFTQSCLQGRCEVLSASYLWLAVTLNYVSHFTIPAFQLWDTNCQHIFLSYHKHVINKPNKYCLNCVTAVGGSSRWARVCSFIRVLSGNFLVYRYLRSIYSIFLIWSSTIPIFPTNLSSLLSSPYFQSIFPILPIPYPLSVVAPFLTFTWLEVMCFEKVAIHS